MRCIEETVYTVTVFQNERNERGAFIESKIAKILVLKNL